MNSNLKRVVFLFLLFIIILFVNFSFAASGNGFSKFDNAPRYVLHINNGNLTINITDYSGIKKENIELFMNTSKGSKLTEENGIKSIKCTEERETKKGKKQVKYEYEIEKKFLDSNYDKKGNSVKFYIKVKDNFGNYVHSYFRIYKKSNSYKVDPAPRINSFKAKGNDVTFNSKDYAGTYELKIFDLNNGTKQVGKTYNKLAKGNAQIKIDLNDFTKGKDGKYRIKFYSKDKNKTDNSDKQMAVTRTVAFSVEDVALKDIKIKEKISLNVGETKKLEVVKKPENATVKKTNYESSDEKIITVDKSGKINAKAEGKAIITVTVDGIKKECEVTVNKVKEVNIDKDFMAFGMNGGVRVGWKKIANATSYKIAVKDYKGKIHTVTVPENVSNHDYDVYRYEIGDYIYWDIKKLDHNFYKINTWMDKNNITYKFKVKAYNGDKEITKSKWLNAIPFNVEKDAPEQNVLLPDISLYSDPEGGAEGVSLSVSDNKTNKINNKRFSITKISEEDQKVTIKWENRVSGFNPSSFIVRYKKNGSNSEFKTMNLESNVNKCIISNLKNEKEYLVQVIAIGKNGNDEVYMLDEEVIVPHTRETRKPYLDKVNSYRGDPFSGNYDLTGYFSRSEAEAFANYGKNGRSFPSNTDYFLWVNMYQVRLYIFTKDTTKEWRLWKDLPVGICTLEHACKPSGEFVIKGREWTDKGENGYALRYLVNYQDYSFGNVFHSVGVGSEHQKMIERSRFCTAGCTTVDIPWLKWIYDYGIGSYLFNDFGYDYR